MITTADKLRASKLGKTLEDYFLDNLDEWENTLSALSQNQEYKISNGQNSKRELLRVKIDEAQTQVDRWTNKLECLETGSSVDAPKIRTVYTAGNLE